MTARELAERGIFEGARVADLRYPFPYRYGTVVDVPGALLIAIRWDDGMHDQRSESSIGAIGMRVSDKTLAALKHGRRAPTSASTK